jgi:uncharacterized protein YqeY
MRYKCICFLSLLLTIIRIYFSSNLRCVHRKNLTLHLKIFTKMNLEEQINADIKAAMLAKDSQKLEGLRAIKSAILLMKTSPEGNTPDAELKALQKMVKQRRETAELYKSQNREDLASVELAQASVIEAYLPKQMSEDEIKAAVKEAITSVGAKGPSDLGKVMGIITKQLAGKADGKTVAAIVKQSLAE